MELKDSITPTQVNGPVTQFLEVIKTRNSTILSLTFHTTSIPALGPTLPPVQWVPGAFSMTKLARL
jgi:hypothetical protein